MTKGIVKYYDLLKNELQDDEIIQTLINAIRDYEDGAIIEVRDELANIVYAITEFEKMNELKYGGN